MKTYLIVNLDEKLNELKEWMAIVVAVVHTPLVDDISNSSLRDASIASLESFVVESISEEGFATHEISKSTRLLET